MPGKDRTERIKTYQKLSHDADDMASSGRMDKTLEILQDGLAQAKKANDEDCRLFFEAELLGYIQPDYDHQIDLLKQALNWQQQNGIAQDSFLFWACGVYYSNKGDQDQAIVWFDKALAANPNDYDAMLGRGLSLSKKGDQDQAILWFDKALAANPNDSNAMRQHGISLSLKGDEDQAMLWFDRALAVNPNDSHAMARRGNSFSKKGDRDQAILWYDKALAANPRNYDAMRQRGVSLLQNGKPGQAIIWFKKALAINPKDSSALRNWAMSEFREGNYEEAIRLIGEAAKLDPVHWRGDFRLLCELMTRDFEKEWRRVFPAEAETIPAGPQEQIPNLKAFIASLRKAYEQDTGTFLHEIETEKEKRKDFLSPESKLDPNKSVLMVLRQWNSYTPAIPSMGEERSRGGGYFLWHEGKGTVIDPGYNFIENLNAAGCKICNIDNIILTHAHNDHTIDFETLCALLHEYNDELPKGATRKKVRMYLSNGAFMKFAGMTNLKDTDYTDHVFTLNADTGYEMGKDLHLQVLPAYHDDLVSRDQCVGLLFTIAGRNVLFTGDTGLFPLEKEGTKLVPNTSGPEVWDRYPKQGDASPRRPDLMIIHIGSIKETELNPDFNLDPKEACYPNHLGIIGTARLITQCRPRLAVVSEFGEEMKTFRMPLMEGLQKNVLNRYCREYKIDPVPRVIPGDLPFVYDLKNHTVYSCVSKEWKEADTVEFGVGKDAKDPVVYYFAPGEKTDFEKDPTYRIRAFQNDREHRMGMYFR